MYIILSIQSVTFHGRKRKREQKKALHEYLWCGLCGGSSLHSIPWPLGDCTTGNSIDLCPTSLHLILPLPRYVDPFYPLILSPSCPIFTIRDQSLRWMVKPSNPQMGWFMAPPFHLCRAEDPWDHVWRALGRDLTAPTPSPQWCWEPNGHSRMVAISHAGSQGSFLKSGKQRARTMRLSPFFPPRFQETLICTVIIYYLCYALLSWGWKETLPCFCLMVGAIAINIATSLGRWKESFLSCIDSIWILSAPFFQLLSTSESRWGIFSIV